MSFLSFFWNQLSDLTLSELASVVGDKIPSPPINPCFLDRIFNQERTFWLFLSQVLSATQSCKEALRKAQMWLLFSKKKKHFFQYIGLLSGQSQVKPRVSGYSGASGP